jgi:uncharacterized protein (DUF1810 family)
MAASRDPDDPYDLRRFVDAQRDVYERARMELAEGRKRGHWMWFVFPQIAGLGHSAMAQEYAIRSLDEARAYLRHPVLGPRLSECVALVASLEGRTAEDVFGPIDALKFRSSLTLFARAAGDPGTSFEQALSKYYGSEPDQLTLERLRRLATIQD